MAVLLWVSEAQGSMLILMVMVMVMMMMMGSGQSLKRDGFKDKRLWGLAGIKVLGQRRGFGSLVVNDRREDEIEEDIAVFGAQKFPERKREGWDCYCI